MDRASSSNTPSNGVQHTKNPLVKALFLIGGCLSAGLGIVGVFIPVLPTTPLLLLAACLFAHSSSKLSTWLESTKAYKSYVLPFRENTGVTLGTKFRMLGISYVVMAISAYCVRNVSVAPFVWALLAAVALFLLWLVAWRLPTLKTAPADAVEGKNGIEAE